MTLSFKDYIRLEAGIVAAAEPTLDPPSLLYLFALRGPRPSRPGRPDGVPPPRVSCSTRGGLAWLRIDLVDRSLSRVLRTLAAMGMAD